MNAIKVFDPARGPMKLALFMSGSGSNARRIIERYLDARERGEVSFEPVLLFTDNPDSNAFRIACGDYADRGFQIPLLIRSIRNFYNSHNCKDIRNEEVRNKFDELQSSVLQALHVDAIALAGYDWRVTAPLYERFLMVNVHPGDLRVSENDGKKAYAGLGWIPSAKAILNGENEVFTSVHLVNGEIDGGKLLAVSEPQGIPLEIVGLQNRRTLLGEAKTLGEILKCIREHPAADEAQIERRFPIYRYARQCQERLKVAGDWVVFPETIEKIACGLYVQDEVGNVFDVSHSGSMAGISAS